MKVKGLIVGGLLLVVAAAFVVVPMLARSHEDRLLQDLRAAMERQHGADAIEVRRVEESWRGSRVEVRMNLAAMPQLEMLEPEFREQLGVFVFEFENRYGPLAFGGACGFAVGAGTSHVTVRAASDMPWYEEAFGNGPMISGCERIGFTGVSSGEFAIPPVSVTQEGVTVEFPSVTMTSERTPSGAYSVTSGLASLSVTGEHGHLTFEGFEVRSRYSDIYAVLPDSSEILMNIDSMNGSVNGELLTADNMTMKAGSELTAAGFDSWGSWSLASLSVGEYQLEDMRYALRFGRLDKEAFVSLVEYFQSQYGTDFAAAPAALEAYMDELQDIAIRVVRNSPTLAVEAVDFTLDGEPFHFEMQASLDGEGFGSFETDALLPRLEGRAMAQATRPLLERLLANVMKERVRQFVAARSPGRADDEAFIESQARQQATAILQNLQMEGLLIEKEAAGLESEIRYDGSQVFLNGQLNPELTRMLDGAVP